MADEQVKLHGSWVSLYSYRVIWALKIKGISYEYIEEDFLYNKSQLLLQYNPVHKKIPVLAHGGKPVCESMIIVEYIEETWPQNPLLPRDPYERASARFWFRFVDDKGPAIWRMFKSRGEEHEKAKTESLEMLRTMEEHALGDSKFFGGDEIGIVDIAFGGFAYWLGVVEDVVGVKLFEDHAYPRLHAWINNFKQVSVIKRNLPDRHRMLVFYKDVREKLLGFTSI